jgi:hypothetical protein
MICTDDTKMEKFTAINIGNYRLTRLFEAYIDHGPVKGSDNVKRRS